MQSVFVALVVFMDAGTASAYKLESLVTPGCHESMTSDVLRAARAARGGSAALAPIAPTRDERALIDDLPFAIASDMTDIGSVGMLLGVRDNDLKGNGAADLSKLAEVHGDPRNQQEHCLRRPEDDGDFGNVTALEACKAFIREKASLAIDALDGADGGRERRLRAPLRVNLAIRGAVTVQLPLVYVALGQAIHALQDGFSHTLRTPDGRRVTAVLDWVETVRGAHVAARDGPSHVDGLDFCATRDALRRTRVAMAKEASLALLFAVVDPGDRASRLGAVDRVLETYLSYEPGCNADNGWCNAPELELRDADVDACSTTAGGSRALFAPTLMIAAALAWTVRSGRRRTRARRRGARSFLGAASAIVITMPCAGTAHADDEIVPSGRSPFGAYASAAGALDHPALAFSVAGRYRLTDRWLTGLDVEWNPFAALQPVEFRRGTLNVYATLARRWAMRDDRFALRTTLHVGTSTLLFDLYGAPSGSTGLFLGLNLLGIEWEVTKNVSVIVDPAKVALPIPQFSGVPFGYLQYRFSIGVQWGG